MSDKTPAPPHFFLAPQTPLVYANMARVAHTNAEFLLDLARYLPGDPHAQVQVRVLLTPFSAKMLARALTESVARYEAVHGAIPTPGEPDLADALFRPPPPEE